VSAEPEITIHEVDWDGDELVIIASDGIWDVVTDKDAVRLVQRCLREGQSEEEAAKRLVKLAGERGTKDDRTAMVLYFGWVKSKIAQAVDGGAEQEAHKGSDEEEAEAEDEEDEPNEGESEADEEEEEEGFCGRRGGRHLLCQRTAARGCS